jgi:DNA invertase Pin-like site-specific DNA recombinase
MDDMKRAVIWKAVSSKEQAEDDRQSLPYQENLARDWCQKNGFEVVSLLELPGHSRSESDVITALEELAAENCFAYHDLRRMWQQKGFDLLIVHTIDRLARSKSLFMWVVENVIKSGADIYFMTPGVLFNKGNVDYTAPMALMGLRSGLDAFLEKGKATKMSKLAQGIPTGGPKPYGFIVLRDDRHRPDGIQVDDSKRPLLRDAAALLLGDVPGAGHVSLRKIELELFNRFGHNKNGEPLPVNFIRSILSNPWTWGHAATFHNLPGIPQGQSTNAWLFDPQIPVPSHVTIHWNTHEPLFPGEVGERLKEEMRLRNLVVKGRGTAKSTRFASLVVCGWCGTIMVRNAGIKNAYPRLRCQLNQRRNRLRDCPSPGIRTEGLPEWRVQHYMQGLLDDMLAHDSPVLDTPIQTDYASQIQQAADDAERLRQEIRNLIARSAASSASIGDLFQQQIDERTKRIEALDAQRLHLEAKQAAQNTHTQQRAFEELKLHRDDFWTLPAPEINRILHGLLGNIRLVVKDNHVIGRMTV